MCSDPDSQYFNHLTCRFYRDFPRLSYFYINAKASLGRSLGMCGNDRELCLAEAQVPWSQTIKAAENVIRVLPPLNVKKTEIDKAIKIIKMVCSKYN